MYRILVLILCFMIIGCSDNSVQEPISKGKPLSPDISQSLEDAYELLANTPHFASTGVGFAGSPPPQVGAFQEIYNSENAIDLFDKLQKEANLEGQLYGLCGLYLVDKDTFDSVVEEYRDDTHEVATFFGCILGETPVSEIVPLIEDGSWPISYRDCVLEE